MFHLLEDFYTQAIRIDLTAASKLAALNPNDANYRAAAERDAFFVTVLQGEAYDGVYSARLERVFETYPQAKLFCNELIAEYPEAIHWDHATAAAAETMVGTMGEDTPSKA
jgi:hypothetical protein